jgi:hypothetical protein
MEGPQRRSFKVLSHKASEYSRIIIINLPLIAVLKMKYTSKINARKSQRADKGVFLN